ncbi:hypothetical protein K2P56_00300 [Patescibacteria group bacterium]|nr:hypothetical protein [Patescibacteria group bacterium]
MAIEGEINPNSNAVSSKVLELGKMLAGAVLGGASEAEEARIRDRFFVARWYETVCSEADKARWTN